MLKFNTTAGMHDRLFTSLEQVFKDFPRTSKTFKTGLLAVVFLCCFFSQSLFSQCNPDVSPPTAICVGPYSIALDGSGQAGIDPDDIDNGSFDGCGAVNLAVSPNLLTCADLGSPNFGSVVITLTVTDLAGNTNFCTTTVTVEDNLPPVPSCPGDITVECNVFDPMNPATSGGSPTATDNCDPVPTIYPYMDMVLSSTGADCYVLKRTWTFEDNEGNTIICIQIITVEDNTNPVLSFNAPAPPLTVNIDCDDPFPAMPMLTATDNCDPSVTIDFNPIDGQDPDPSMCGHYTYTFIRVWDAIDNCGNISSKSQVINVSDNDPPTFMGAPTTKTVSASATCLTSVTLTVQSFVDDCAGDAYLTTTYEVYQNVPWTLVKSGNGLDASGDYLPGNYTVIFSAEDPCGNQGFHNVALKVVDNIPPTAICSSLLITVSIPPTGMATLQPSQINNGSYDNCTPTANLALSLSPNTFDCGDVGGFPETVVLTVTDANGNSATCSASVNVVDNSPPAVLCQDTITRYLMADGTVTVAAIEIDNGSFDLCGIDFYEISKDGGATYGPTTTFLCPETGINSVLLRVTDDAGNEGVCPSVVKVFDNIAPNASMACSNETVYLDQSGMYMLDFLQFDSTKTNGTNVTITDGPVSVTSTLTFYGTGVIKDVNVLNMIIDHNRIGDLSFTLTSPTGTVVTLGNRPGFPGGFLGLGCAEDDILASFDDSASSPAEAFETSCDPTPPAISGIFQPLQPLSAFNGEDVNGVWTLTVTDNTGFGTTSGFLDSWSLQINYQKWGDTQIGYGSDDNCCASIDNLSQTMFTCNDIDTNPNLGGNQPVIYTLTITDPSGNTGQCTSTITVLDTIRPMITCLDTISVCLDADGIGKIYPDSLLNGGIYLSSGNNGTFAFGNTQFCVTVSNAMTISFDWDYHSNNSHAGWDPFGYSVNGAFTQLTSGLACNFLGSTTQSGTANVVLSAGNVFCFEAQTCDNFLGEAEIWIKNFSEAFTGDFGQQNWSSKFTNSDGKAFFVDASIACHPVTYEITLDSMIWDWQACDSLFCDSLDLYVNAWVRAIDEYGNVSDTCLVKLHVEDKEPPVAACDEVVVSLNGNGQATKDAIAFDDGSIDACSPPLSFMVSIDDGINFFATLNLNCSHIGIHEAILKVTDSATIPNNAFCLTQLTVQDNLAPVITCPSNKIVNCNASINPISTGFATAMDNCAGVVTPTWTDTDISFISIDCRTIRRRWRAEDNDLPTPNVSICDQIITVQDLVSPVLPNVNNATVQCTPTAAPVLTATDNCDANVNVVFTEIDDRFAGFPLTNQFSPSECGYYNYTLSRTWTATDNCGNTDVETQTLTVQDTQKPVFSYTNMVMVGNTPGQCSGFATVDVTNAVSDCAAFQYLTITYVINGNMVIHNGPNASGNFNVGTHTIVFTAVDPCGNSSTHTVTVIIKDNETPSPICNTGPIPLTLNSNGIATITPATVNNGSNDNCFVASLNVAPAIFDCFTTPNPHTVTLTVTDAAGNSNTCTTSVIITNVSTPAIVCPSSITVSCVVDESNPANTGGFATATTACGPVTPTFTDVTVSGLGDCRVINRTWKATTAGGMATCLQVITVQDNNFPVLSGVPADVTVDCFNIPVQAAPTATDLCDLSPTIGFVQTNTRNADPNNCLHYNYSITRTWTATDDCGNATTDYQVITVLDDDDPVVSIPNPLIIPTDPDDCFATVNVNLLSYVVDCAADPFLDIVNDALANYGKGNGTDNINGVYVPGDYPIEFEVTDPCGNDITVNFVLRIKDMEAPQAVCLPATTLILDGNGTGSLVPADIDNGSADNCGAVTLSISPNTFNVSDVGVVNVVLTVTDGAGNTSQCSTPVTVIERGSVSADDVQGGVGANVSIPVTVTGFDDICAVSLSIHVDDPLVATVTGVSGFGLPGMSVFDFSIIGNDIALSWVSGMGVTIPDGSTIFNVDVTLVGGIGTSSTVTINNSPISVMFALCNLNTVPTSAIDGSVSVVTSPSNVLLDGSVETELNVPIELVQMSLTGNVGGNQVTGPAGTYGFSVPSGSNETITPSKDINDCNGINVLDVLALQLHILGDPMFQLPTTYRRIAADINGDGSINVLDRLELHLIVLNGVPCIGLSSNTSWRFVDASYAFPDPLNPFVPAFPESIVYTNVTTPQTGNFVGMKIGDLNLDGDPANFNGGAVNDGFNGKMLFAIDDHSIIAGNEYRVDFKAKDLDAYRAYQYTLEFNSDVLQFKQVEMGAMPKMNVQNFGLDRVGEGIITSIWYSDEATAVSDDEILFTLVFDAVADAGKLSSLLDILSEPVVSEAYSSDYAKKDIGLTFNNLTGLEDVLNSKFALYQNRPNPFGTETIIPFYLSQATHTTLTITDVSGRAIKTLEGDFGRGSHSFKVSREDLPSTGVFFYRLESEYGMAIKKMVLLD